MDHVFFGEGTPYADYRPGQLNRLNERYKRIIGSNIDLIAGKRLLDLAAHNGRWTWAALKSGAAYVEAVEGRPELVASATEALSSFPQESYRFSCGDILDFIEGIKPTHVGRFDTILCLGIFYHVDEHFRLLRLMTGLKPSAIIIDSGLLVTEQRVIRFYAEETGDKLNAIPGKDQDSRAIVGTMSRGLLEMWCRLKGWSITYIKWRGEDIADQKGLTDYLKGENPGADDVRARFTCVLRPIAPS